MDRRTWKKFWKSYNAAGGWAGPATAGWVADAALILMLDYGVTARAAGLIMADKQQCREKFTRFAESSQFAGQILYALRPWGSMTDIDHKIDKAIRNGALSGQIAEMIA